MKKINGMKKKSGIKQIFNQVIAYYKRHIWCKFIALYIIAVLGIALIFRAYLKNQYYPYLKNTQLMMENAVLDNAEDFLKLSLMEYINTGAEIATSKEICELANTYERAKTSRNRLDLQTYLTANGRNSSKIVAMTIINEEGLLFQYDAYKTTKTYMWSADNNEILLDAFARMQSSLQEGELPRYLFGNLPGNHPSNEELEVFHIYFPMIGASQNLQQVDKVLCLTVKMDVIYQFVNSLDESELDYLHAFVTNEEGKIICHGERRFVGMEKDEYLDSYHLIPMGREIDKIGWNVWIAYDDNKVKEYIDEIYQKSFILYLPLIGLLMFLLYLIIKRVLRPVNQIHNAIAAITNYGGAVSIEIAGEDEFWQLAMRYNEMLEALKKKEKEVEYHHEQMLISMERQHEAEREALETQINGHFLCNTLNTINYEAIEEGSHKVSVLIKKLSNILRYSFDQKCQNVYFYQEFAWIEQYLYLMKARLEDVFSYEVQIEDEVSSWPCCKLILQPFVENAILHGFEGRQEGGLLYISARKADDYVKIRIKDNGNGIDEKTEQVIQDMLNHYGKTTKDGIGIGVRNVLERMHLYYGDDMKVELVTGVGEGTEFIFYLPFPKGRLYRRRLE